MATEIFVKHKESGIIKKGYYGFSWTYLVFGWFVPTFRRELGVAALHLLFSIASIGVWPVIVSFLYDKQYMTRILTHGWVLSGDDSENTAAAEHLGIARPIDRIDSTAAE